MAFRAGSSRQNAESRELLPEVFIYGEPDFPFLIYHFSSAIEGKGSSVEADRQEHGTASLMANTCWVLRFTKRCEERP